MKVWLCSQVYFYNWQYGSKKQSYIGSQTNFLAWDSLNWEDCVTFSERMGWRIKVQFNRLSRDSFLFRNMEPKLKNNPANPTRSSPCGEGEEERENMRERERERENKRERRNGQSYKEKPFCTTGDILWRVSLSFFFFFEEFQNNRKHPRLWKMERNLLLVLWGNKDLW